MTIGIVKPVRIEEEMKGAYLDYAMSVITARALPDVRDGLKPVQRRILYAMDELGLRHTAAYKKSARIVGEVMGKYHPHGDAPVYEAMVRLAQDFSMRYPLVDGQGNFGSVDGDPPAAMRYTEARLTALAEETLADIDKETVAFAANFDDTLKEPKVLPSKLPNLLVNGSTGIAVGMATNIPPHNLNEVADALIHFIARFGEAIDGGVPFNVVWARAFNNPADPDLAKKALAALNPAIKQRVDTMLVKAAGEKAQRQDALIQVVDDIIDITPARLMEFVKGPDFPTSGVILGVDGIKNAYATGHGRITIRAKAHTEDMRGGRKQIIVTELPFQVNKAALLEKIAELVRERRVEGISELRDESDRQGMRVVIELRREAHPRQILNQLFKYTSMQTAFSVNMLALVDGQPRVLTLKMVLLHYLNHRREVITRRTEFDLARAKHRAHILEGLKIALDHLDEVISTIRRSKDADAARAALIKNFKLSEIQAQAILEMQLRRLAALERQKIRDEYNETIALIKRLADLLANPVKILYLIRDELGELKTKFGDTRRTQILTEETADFTEEDLIPEQEMLVSVTAKGYVRRVVADGYRMQRRGTKGIAGTISKEDDPPVLLALASSRDNLLLFGSLGRAYQVKVYDLPEATRQARGLPLSNFISLDEQERVVAALPMEKLEGRHLVLATRRGEVKRISATEFSGARVSGIAGFAVAEGDELIGVVATSGRQDVLLISADGQSIRFGEAELRPSGRGSGGVRGIRMGDRDHVVSIDVVRAGSFVVVITRRGFGKRTTIDDFSKQGRGGGGVRAANVSVKNGELVAGRVAGEADELVLVSHAGTVLRLPASGIQTMGRAVLGVPVVELGRDDRVVAVGLIPPKDKDNEGASRGGSPVPQNDAGDQSGAGKDASMSTGPTVKAAGVGLRAPRRGTSGARTESGGESGMLPGGKLVKKIVQNTQQALSQIARDAGSKPGRQKAASPMAKGRAVGTAGAAVAKDVATSKAAVQKARPAAAAASISPKAEKSAKEAVKQTKTTAVSSTDPTVAKVTNVVKPAVPKPASSSPKSTAKGMPPASILPTAPAQVAAAPPAKQPPLATTQTTAKVKPAVNIKAGDQTVKKPTRTEQAAAVANPDIAKGGKAKSSSAPAKPAKGKPSPTLAQSLAAAVGKGLSAARSDLGKRVATEKKRGRASTTRVEQGNLPL